MLAVPSPAKVCKITAAFLITNSNVVIYENFFGGLLSHSCSHLSYYPTFLPSPLLLSSLDMGASPHMFDNHPQGNLGKHRRKFIYLSPCNSMEITSASNLYVMFVYWYYSIVAISLDSWSILCTTPITN